MRKIELKDEDLEAEFERATGYPADSKSPGLSRTVKMFELGELDLNLELLYYAEQLS